jgi:hypothetical protein
MYEVPALCSDQHFRMNIGALISLGVVSAKHAWKKKGRFTAVPP